MSLGPWDGPKQRETCPYCGEKECEADWCDIGVGMQQVGPFHCHQCGASEVGSYDTNTLDPDEKRTGWFKPKHTGTTVNTAGGVPVYDYKVASKLYQMGILDPKPCTPKTEKRP